MKIGRRRFLLVSAASLLEFGCRQRPVPLTPAQKSALQEAASQVYTDPNYAATQIPATQAPRQNPTPRPTPPPTAKPSSIDDVVREPRDPAKFPDLLDYSTTPYGGTLPNRIHNVELSARRLNGSVVDPGEIFSFNGAIGEISYRAGYLRAYGITQDESSSVLTIPAEGGGICQVSSTLFQAAFWAGMRFIERNTHKYWIPRYGEPPKGFVGLDATVDQVFDSNGTLLKGIDLKWQNSGKNPVYIEAVTSGGILKVSLYGTNPGWKVTVPEHQISNEKTPTTNRAPAQIDPTLPPGSRIMIESARNGFDVTFVRWVSIGSTVLSRQRFNARYYPAQDIYAVGPPR